VVKLDSELLDQADTAASTRSQETAIVVTPSEPPAERDDAGRFARGHRGRGGRPPGRSITAVLRRLISPEQIARKLIEFATDPETPKREQLQALGMIFDRVDGRPVSTTILDVATERQTGQGLPDDYYSWSVEERRQWLVTRTKVLS